MIILGVDPGKKTGWSIHWDLGTWGAWEDDQRAFEDWAEAWLAERASSLAKVLVVCERFVISGGTTKMARGDANWSLEQIGVCRFLARKYGHEFALSSASDAMRLVSNDRLKTAGRYLPGRGHANDATRHVLKTVAERDPDGFARLIGA